MQVQWKYCTMKGNMLAMNKTKLFGTACFAVAFAALVSSCGDNTTRSTGWEFSRNMYDPIGNNNPDQPNTNFANGQTAQTPPEGTTPVGFERFDYPNTLEGYEAASLNFHSTLERTEKNLKDGAMLYHSFCSPCHGPEGKGDGTIVNMEKFPPPPSYSTGTSSRGGQMKDLTDGKIYHTITYGLNLMGSHASQLSPDERWKVVMYVHELQKK
ncbi:Cytochrome C oxidase, cbb3-type, subunit III [Olivibacter domesticus]|uniref:Cytochrome C oxidase, cbb3-type, subunit III n=2 Tax=Olivibacter domesticus TaxID=407022 RepID=A0A1H7VMT8_OLID1|nr:Cytochrome C oxidase, cbb3-type, subunit III [Olivibacter domesticus]